MEKKHSFTARAAGTYAAVGAAFTAAPSFAYVDAITGAVDWSTVVAGIGVIAGALALVGVARVGAGNLLGMLFNRGK